MLGTAGGLLVALAMLVKSLRARRRFRRRAGAFPCKVRLSFGTVRGLKRDWPRGRDYAVWVHDVLLVLPGRVRSSPLVLPVASVESRASTRAERDELRFGLRPLQLVLRLDDGCTAVLAAPELVKERAVGPYIAAHIFTPRG